MAYLEVKEDSHQQRYRTFIAVTFLLALRPASLAAKPVFNVTESYDGLFSVKETSSIEEYFDHKLFVSTNQKTSTGIATPQDLDQNKFLPSSRALQRKWMVSPDVYRASDINQTAISIKKIDGNNNVTERLVAQDDGMFAAGDLSRTESLFQKTKHFIRTESDERLLSRIFRDDLQTHNGSVATLPARREGDDTVDCNQTMKDSFESRIIGGVPAKIVEFPFIATLRQLPDHHMCGASIVSPSFILTAAHCVVKKFGGGTVGVIDKNHLYLIAGSSNADGSDCDDCKRTIQFVRKIYVHPDFMKLEMSSDVALLYVWYRFKFGKYLKQAPLPKTKLNDSFFEPGKQCVTAGWGYMDPETGRHRLPSAPTCRRKSPSTLMKVTLPLSDWETCAATYEEEAKIKVCHHVCTASPEGKDACHGDSGGPLLCDGLLVGVTSFGKGCGQPNVPAVFARVDTKLSWLLDVIRSHNTIASSSYAQVAVAVAVLLCFNFRQ